MLIACKEICELLFIKSSKSYIKGLCLQGFNLDAQKLLVPARIHCHAVIRQDVCFLLSLGEVVHVNARNLLNMLLASSKNSAMPGDDVVVLVDNDWINESKFPQRSPKLIDLLRAVGSGVIYIWN